MTVRDFAQELLKIKPELQDKEVKIKAENGLMLPARILYQIKDFGINWDITKENIEYIVIGE